MKTQYIDAASFERSLDLLKKMIDSQDDRIKNLEWLAGSQKEPLPQPKEETYQIGRSTWSLGDSSYEISVKNTSEATHDAIQDAIEALLEYVQNTKTGYGSLDKLHDALSDAKAAVQKDKDD
jgi:hypothetical protein